MTEQEIEQLIESESELNRRHLGPIRELVPVRSTGLRPWCVRQRRREAVARTVVALCLFVGVCWLYSATLETPLCDRITTTGTSDNRQICEIVRHHLGKV